MSKKYIPEWDLDYHGARACSNGDKVTELCRLRALETKTSIVIARREIEELIDARGWATKELSSCLDVTIKHARDRLDTLGVKYE